jgi:DNA mismatch repair protein MutL
MSRPGDAAPTREGRRVHVLPDALANQIAAGEVVERPASVVKELVENAIDAGARRVAIDIRTGGLELIRVADDGSGMPREDAALAILRHATSKIERLEDLHRLASFGFRGEAIPSIASVSRFALRTRRAADDEGTEVRVEGGGEADVRPVGCAPGTIVEVRDLFFNVPARRKFLRSPSTESGHVTEVAEAAALASPDVTVVLTRDGRSAEEWLRAPSREEKVRAALGGEGLAACRGQRGPLTVEAFLSRPERARSGAGGLTIFVNDRPVRDRQLARAVANAYGSVLDAGRYPLGVVYLDLPHELVDVNVHPQKAEVRFADARAVGDALYKVLGADLSRAFGLPAPGANAWAGKKQKLFDEGGEAAVSTWSWSSAPGAAASAPAAPAVPPRVEAATSPAVAAPEPDPWGLAAVAPAPLPAPVPYPRAPEPSLALAEPAPAAPAPPPVAAAPAARDGVPFHTLRFVAQVRRTFLICEGKDGLYILDQHAAHERVTFDRLRKARGSRDVPMQRLLFPALVAVSATEASLVEEAQDEIAHAGLDVRAAGVSQVAVHAVPKLLARAAPERLVRDLLDEIGRSGGRAFSDAIDLALATMACHGSIRAGDPIADDEAKALLAALDEVDFAGHCPHGRPIVTSLRWSELEHGVGRR